MNKFVLFLLICSALSYDRHKAIEYAYKYVDNPNHKCGDYQACKPYSYWGSEACGYQSHGGDCANFVSQCLIAGGHPKLSGNKEYCRGWPCGVEPGAAKLAMCLHKKFGWKSTCGKLQKPPSNIQVGDVLIYHSGSCSGGAHATIISKIEGGRPKITCHSNKHKDMDYDYMKNSKNYYEWLHHE